MADITMDERIRILETIRRVSDPAKWSRSALSDFFPMQGYAPLCNQYRYLILGPQGSGKSSGFRAFIDPDGFHRIREDQLCLFAGRCDIVPGYCRSNCFPAADVLDQYATDKLAKFFWAGSLLCTLASLPRDGAAFVEIMDRVFGRSQSALFQGPESRMDPSRWIGIIVQNRELWRKALDDFDAHLRLKDRWAIVAYDDLDMLTSRHMDLYPFLRALLFFWAKHSRGWERLRCKIFLRTDLYESRRLDFLDASYISNNTAVLRWTNESLYQLLIKKIINRSQPAHLYVRGIPGLIAEKDELLGYLPSNDESLLQAFADRLMGRHMGDSPLHGPTYHWVYDHLQDANGILAPASFLRCFSTAADLMLHSEEAMASLKGDQLILPVMLEKAVPTVSQARLANFLEKNPWLEQLKEPFRGLSVPMDRDEFIELLDMDLWSPTQQDSLPGRTPYELFSALQKLGILFVHGSFLDVPTIYQYAFGMQRQQRRAS